MSDLIENKVAKSGIVTLNLEEMKPDWKMMGIDMVDYLFEGLVLREKDFRERLKEQDWSMYQDAHVYIHCSADAIIPTWAYMLMARELEPVAKSSIVGSKQDLERALWSDFVASFDAEELQDARVVIKGCGEEAIPDTVYHQLSARLMPVVKSLMFGEPCSTVPVFKRR